MTPRAHRPVLVLIGAGVVATAIVTSDPVRRTIQTAWDGDSGPAPTADGELMPLSRPVHDFALSPDGRALAFTATGSDGRRRLWVRRPPDAMERPIAGTDGASSPFWSRDSSAIAYVAEGILRTVAASGGTSAAVGEGAPVPGAWHDEAILFVPDDGRTTLHRITATGGHATPVTRLGPGETGHGWPAFLPDGRRFLYTVTFESGRAPAIHLGSLDATDGREVLSNASHPAVADGYLVYLRDGALMVQLFDTELLIPRSDPIPVDEGGSTQAGQPGVASFSLSRDGMLAYQHGSVATAGEADARPLTLVDWRTTGRR